MAVLHFQCLLGQFWTSFYILDIYHITRTILFLKRGEKVFQRKSTQEVQRFYNLKIKKFYVNDNIERFSVRKYQKSIGYIPSGWEIVKKYKDNYSVGRVSASKCQNQLTEVRQDSLARSRNLLIDYAIQNKYKFKSFVTLTFSENITDLDVANNKFNIWIKQVKRKLKEQGQDFYYLGVPEFQKRGAVHYHLLTSLECGSLIIPRQEIKMLWNSQEQKYKTIEYYNLKFWNNGFSSAFDIVNDTDSNFNIGLYITKYLYKDLDNRLYGRTRVLKSNNLQKPVIEKLIFESEEYKNAIQFLSQKKYDEISSYNFGGVIEKPFLVPFIETTFIERV